MSAARALAVLAAAIGFTAAPAAAQMPNAIVGGTNLLEAAQAPIPVGVPSSSDRTTAPETRATDGTGTISLAAVSAPPGGEVPSREAVVPVAAIQTAPLAEPGAPVRVRRLQSAAGDPIRATTGTAQTPAGRPIGPGAPIVISRDVR